MMEVASTTCADIIGEILIVVICTPICTPEDRLRQLNLDKGLYHISMNISEFD